MKKSGTRFVAALSERRCRSIHESGGRRPPLQRDFFTASTAWDYHFRKGRAYWVWLTFKNGKVMAGLFGPNSFASSFPHKRDLYVEKLLRLDENGGVVELIENSSGALVAMEDLERIEFFELDEVKI